MMINGENLTFAEFAFANKVRCESGKGFKKNLDKWSVSDWFLAVGGELGEAMNAAKKLNRIRDGIPGNDPSDTEESLLAQVREEIADTFIYLDPTAAIGSSSASLNGR